MSATTHDRAPAPGRITRTVNATTLACWPAAFAVFLLHVAGLAFLTARAFNETACWLIAIGCCGCPAFALRALGRHATARVCTGIGIGFAGAAVLFTALDATGYIDPTPSNRLIGLVLLLAIAIQSLNGADQMHARDRQHAAHQAELAALRQQWAEAVARARVNHLESCTIAHDRHQRRMAELLDAAADLTDTEARVLEYALGRRTAHDDSETTAPLNVISIQQANGAHH